MRVWVTRSREALKNPGLKPPFQRWAYFTGLKPGASTLRFAPLKKSISPKHEKPAISGGLLSLYFQFSNLGGNSTPNWLRSFLFGMCELEDFLASGDLTRILADQD